MNAVEKDVVLADRIFSLLDPSSAHTRSFTGLTAAARTLRRAELTLHKWSECEANGIIQRLSDGGRPQGFSRIGAWLGPVPDREVSTLRRVERVCGELGLHYYYQQDPRGCALYVSTGPLTDTNYTSGVSCHV
jgi:hypothetical protein